ncbi:MAG: hypothetical protein GWP67_10290 [Gammaproteobacteria bacterium]|jgi:hypothetical protein|nr:hypothetical protein [Gammaproteobacteria bacterium]
MANSPQTWSIFGCGPAGLYTAWRLVTTGKIKEGDKLSLFEWGKYRLDGQESGTRAPAGRICTYHHEDNPRNSFVEIGGMRYIHWNGDDGEDAAGHRLVTTVIDELELAGTAIPFNTTNDPLFYLRARNFYSSDISSSNPAPYAADHSLAAYPPASGDLSAYQYVADQVFCNVKYDTRKKQLDFYAEGKVPDSFRSDVFKPGDLLSNIGFWNLAFDQQGGEGYRYAAAGGGYQANVINVNSANAVIINNEFVPGQEFKTLRSGYSSIYPAMFDRIRDKCTEVGIELDYQPGTRLRSIWLDPKEDNRITFTVATADDPNRASDTDSTDCAFLALPPGSLDIVADGSRYMDGNIVDVLNAEPVALYRDSVVTEPSYKIAMFFDSEWWNDSMYPPRLSDHESNIDPDTGKEIPNVFGPTITDTPLRQVYYFGDNAVSSSKKVYSLLASYDDERFYRFWQELELGPNEIRETPLSEELQPLEGGRKAPEVMVNMLRSQLARVHWGPGATASLVPEPLETVFMDWSLKPFSAGYHGWAPHYDMNDVMRQIRKPTQLMDDVDADLFIVGSAFSNDQAWVEGAFCTAESVLTKFLDVEPIIDQSNYPFIAGGDED